MMVRGAQFFCFMACKITYYYAVPAVSIRPVSDFYCTTYSRRKQAAVHDHHGNWRQPDVSSRRDIVEKFINKNTAYILMILMNCLINVRRISEILFGYLYCVLNKYDIKR